MATNNSINSLDPIQVALGGSGVASTTAYAVLCGGTTSTGALQPIASVGTSGQVLTSNGAAALPTFQASVAAGVSSATGTANQITVSASTGAVTWSTPSTFIAPGTIASTTTTTAGTNLVSTAGNLLLPTTSSTVGQIEINSIQVLHSFGTRNIFAGNAGNFTLSGADNIGIGNTSLNQLTSGASNVCIGSRSATQKITTGSQNNSHGNDALTRLTTGNNNNCFGQAAGFNYTSSESNNILIGDGVLGTTGESNVCRIGLSTGTGTSQVNQTFIAGIRGTTTVNANAIAVLIDSAGQLGTVSSSIRYKENVQDMGDDSSPIMDLRPVTFNYISHPEIKAFGLIAEEVLPIMPELVAYNSDGEVESVKYQDIAVMLLNEVQKLTKRIEALEAK